MFSEDIPEEEEEEEKNDPDKPKFKFWPNPTYVLVEIDFTEKILLSPEVINVHGE